MADFTLELTPSAQNDLADLWLRSPDPVGVTRADAAAYLLLRRDPLGCGVHVSEGLYRLTVAPLVYYYAVDTTRSHVRVAVISEVR